MLYECSTCRNAKPINDFQRPNLWDQPTICKLCQRENQERKQRQVQERKKRDLRKRDRAVSERLRRAQQNTDRTGFVYFIQDGDDGPIKIGFSSTSAEERCVQLQCGNPRKLKIIGTIPGNKLTEAKLHERFQEAHVRGEWYDAAIVLPYVAGIVKHAQIGAAA